MSPSSRGKRSARSSKPRRTFGARLRRFFMWSVLVCLVLALIGVGTFVVAYNQTEVPDPNKDFQTETSFVYYADGKDELGRYATQNRESIPLSQVPEVMKQAVVSAEDRSFWTNRGIDPKGIVRAAFSNARGGDTQGASTITQQYVKILYLTQEQTYTRKAKEALLSLRLQRDQSKEQILEGYLNTIYFGRGAYGIQAAAEAYFNKPAKRLNAREAVVLASVINNPTRFDPKNGRDNRQALKARYDYVFDGMVDLGYMSEEQAEKQSRRLPRFPEVKQENSKGGQTGFMLDMVEQELKTLKNSQTGLPFSEEEISGGGLRITTTFSRKAMEAAESAVMEERPEVPQPKQLHVATATVEVGTGALRGFYAGQDYVESQLNWALSGGMVGSTMKPFTLAAALEAGFSLKDGFAGNSPLVLDGGLDIENQGEGLGTDFGERVTPITAMENSINTAFVDMTQGLPHGAEDIWRTARAAGIPPAKPNPKYPGMPSTSNADFNPDNFLLTLGNAVISPINLANAYATIANGGRRADAHVVEKVIDRNGTVLYERKNRTTEAIPEDVAADVSYTLQQTVSGGTASPALALGRPAAAKTGTATNDDGDVSSAWFAGYTPQMATAVMYVRGKGAEALDGWLPSYYGGDYPASTWTNLMEKVMEGMEVEDFPEPAWVDGDAPSDGYAPPAPPPAPAPEPQPEKKEKKVEVVVPGNNGDRGNKDKKNGDRGGQAGGGNGGGGAGGGGAGGGDRDGRNGDQGGGGQTDGGRGGGQQQDDPGPDGGPGTGGPGGSDGGAGGTDGTLIP